MIAGSIGKMMLAVALVGAMLPEAGSAATKPLQRKYDQYVDGIIAKEAETVQALKGYTPLVETYSQEFGVSGSLRGVPTADHYMLGHVSFDGPIADADMLGQSDSTNTSTLTHDLKEMVVKHQQGLVPVGFAQMAMPDTQGFDRSHYRFEYERTEFLGDVRCMIFNIFPKARSGHGRFLGRIWVEDRAYNIVRFNGTYVRPVEHVAYLHFDSWRINISGDKWLPAYIYSEESSLRLERKTIGFRAQTRLWNYAEHEPASSQMTEIEMDANVEDQTESQDVAPLTAARMFALEAEDNVIERMERAGVLSAPSDIDRQLETIANNILASNGLTLTPGIRCRVLMTSPVESFTVGHTIVMSRGLLDVLPDQGAIAAILARELAHVVLGHRIDTKFAFSDRLLFGDAEILRRLSMARSVEEDQDADKKGMELIAKSPYANKMNGTSVFFQQLAQVRTVLPNLVQGRMGDSLIDGKSSPLAAIVASGPRVDAGSLTQETSLPLGARIVVNPWDNHIGLSSTDAMQMLTLDDKRPFQIMPFYLKLKRVKDTKVAQTGEGGTR